MTSKSKMDRKRTNVLIIFANPRNTDPLRLSTEDRTIREALRLSTYRDNISTTICHAATIHDIRRALLNGEFQIVHISGHGTKQGLLLEDERGGEQLVPPPALERLLEAYSPPIKCILLNACYSTSQGNLTSLGIPFTIAMENAISDQAAIEFSRGFYDAIGAGKSFEFSYEEGCRTVELTVPNTLFESRLLVQDKTLRHFLIQGDEVPPKDFVLIKLGDKFIAMKPSLYPSLQNMLDELYLDYLRELYEPYSYGSSWIIGTLLRPHDYFGRLLVSYNWLLHCYRNQPVSEFDPSWGTLSPDIYGMRARTYWEILNPIELVSVFGLVFNTKETPKELLLTDKYNSKQLYAIILSAIRRANNTKLLSPEAVDYSKYKSISIFFSNGFEAAIFGFEPIGNMVISMSDKPLS